MATEEDKTNTGIAGTAIAVGVAAMIAGSAALVSMARAEMDDLSEETQAYANLGAIKALKAEQVQKLSASKVSIDKARASTLSALKSDPEQASPWTPKAPPPAASSAASESGDTAAAGSAAVSEAPPSDSAAATSAARAESAPAEASAPGEAPEALENKKVKPE
jgi:hypothetical protein